MSEEREPTGEECSANVVINETDAAKYVACWYPQMGGYVGKAIVEVLKNWSRTDMPSCFDVWVWHDGEFPFHDGEPPAHLHHCDADQFVNFGNKINALQLLHGKRVSREEI